ncbi:hypothetical protein PRJ39_15930 [Lysobacter enzymogenes]|uniref:hypothetical protein n=1 Tax=Lysobacter enzymogenes TaxID=69 RepID=UPI0037491740
MSKLPPPQVPPKLRELLSDYPGYVDRLQEVLDEFAVPKLRLQPFDDALWALESRLDAFVQDARDELRDAEASGDASAIEKAAVKRRAMSLARSKNGGMRVELMDDLWNYFERNKEAFE